MDVPAAADQGVGERAEPPVLFALARLVVGQVQRPLQGHHRRGGGQQPAAVRAGGPGEGAPQGGELRAQGDRRVGHRRGDLHLVAGALGVQLVREPGGRVEDERGGRDHPEGAGVDEEELLLDPDGEGARTGRGAGARGAVARFDHCASLDIRVFFIMS
ncbi:hypothetical protein GCM10020254_56860 [Streptomyces goshikiensis]